MRPAGARARAAAGMGWRRAVDSGSEGALPEGGALPNGCLRGSRVPGRRGRQGAGAAPGGPGRGQGRGWG